MPDQIILTVPDAQEKAAAFQRELDALLDRYKVHAFVGVLTLQTSDAHDIWYAATVRGCGRCVALTTARTIARDLTLEDLELFTRSLAGFNRENIEANEDPAIRAFENLQVAKDEKGEPWKN